MMTNLQHLLIKYTSVQILFDVLYLLLPVSLYFCVIRKWKLTFVLAIATAAFSFIYNWYFSIMTFVSIEVSISWMLLPLLFCFRTHEGFYYNLQSIRIIFLCIFFSAGVWKIASGGIFNGAQMSAILLTQHTAFLSAGDGSFVSKIILFLIKHRALAYCFYFFAFIGEIAFSAGFFTKKFDKVLLLILALFIVSDYLLMHINYFSWLAFAGCFLYSRCRPESLTLSKS